MKAKKTKTNLGIIFYMLILIPIFKPASIEAFENINRLFKALKILSILVLFLYALVCIRDKGLTRKVLQPVICLISFWGIYIFNLVRYGISSSSEISNAVCSILLTFSVYYAFKSKRIKCYMVAVEIIFTLWILLQVVSLFLIDSSHMWFGNIGDKTSFMYFLGLDNYSAFGTLPMIGILLFMDYKRYNKIRLKEIVLLLLLLMSYVYVRSATAVLAYLIFVFLILTYRYWGIIRAVLSVKKILFLLAVLWFLIYVFNFQELFATFLTSSILGKASYDHGITLNSRTIIWKYAVKLIMNKPLLGYGALTDDMIQARALYGIDHCHNIFLEILFRTGMIGFGVYFYYLLVPFKNQSKKWSDSGFKILLFTMISLMILSFMDYYPNLQYLYVLYAVIYFMDISTTTTSQAVFYEENSGKEHMNQFKEYC